MRSDMEQWKRDRLKTIFIIVAMVVIVVLAHAVDP